MATDLSVVNAARVSFARRKDEMDESDEGLIRFLMRDRHGTPFEHNSFRFHVRAPIFVAREWFRHRVGRSTSSDALCEATDDFYVPEPTTCAARSASLAPTPSSRSTTSWPSETREELREVYDSRTRRTSASSRPASPASSHAA